MRTTAWNGALDCWNPFAHGTIGLAQPALDWGSDSVYFSGKAKKLPRYPDGYEWSNRLLTRREQREAERKSGRRKPMSIGRFFATVTAIVTMALSAAVYPTIQFVQQQVERYQTELQGIESESDRALLLAADAARALLFAAQLADDYPFLGDILRDQTRHYMDEWLDAMPESARGDVAQILNAFINGADYETIEAMIINKVTFVLARSSPLDQINDQSPDNHKALKQAIDTRGENAFLTSEDSSIHYWYLPAQPGKPTILFSNGRGADMMSAANLILQAQEQGYGFMIYEYPGNGDSTGPLTQDGYYDSGELALQYLMEDKRILAENVLLVGYSLGTNIASYLLATHPDLKNAVLISPMGKFETVYDAIIQKYTDTLLAWLALDSSRLKNFDTISFYLEGLVQEKKISFFYGDQDTFVKPDQTIEVYEAAGDNNDARIHEILGQNHTTIRENPDSVAQILATIGRDFYDEP